MTTIGQAYSCILAHYYAAPVLDDRVLLAGAFAGLTQQLDRFGQDQPGATLPALTGNHDGDWARFAAVYQRITGALPAHTRQQAAEATMIAMVAALGDNHAEWQYPVYPPHAHPGDDADWLGIYTSPGQPLAQQYPDAALPPLYVCSPNSAPATGSSSSSPPTQNGLVSPSQ